jgi:hypothetical protein
VQPTFISLSPGVPRYAPSPAEERPYALGYLHLSSDEETLWGAASPVRKPKESAPGEVTILRYSEAEDEWNQVLGYGSDPNGVNPFTQPGRTEEENETVNSIAAEPATPDAWLALTSPDNTQAERSDAAQAMVARINAGGEVSERQTLPSAAEGLTAKGAAERIVCPATNDCWLVTSKGWLFHYSDEADRQLPENGDPAFSQLVTFRPPDAGIPQVVPDAPPVDDSGLLGEPPPTYGSPVETKATPTTELKVPVALMSDVHTHEHGTTLELSFRLVVKARVRLIADRGKKRVASTPMRTLAAGSHKLVLHLNRREWPTKLSLESHPLAPLPTTTVKQAVGGPEHGGNGSTSVSTGLAVLPDVSWLAKSELRP